MLNDNKELRSARPTNPFRMQTRCLSHLLWVPQSINQSTKRNIAEKLPSPDAPKFSNQTNHYRATIAPSRRIRCARKNNNEISSKVKPERNQANDHRACRSADTVDDQKIPRTFLLPPSSLVLASALAIGLGSGGAAPAAAPRMSFRRCLAFSLPFSAARTYQTLASNWSRRQPMPISVK